MGVGPQGNWSVPQAIVKRWNESSLDAQLRARWPSDTADDEFNTLNDSEARAGTPPPYIVYEVGVNPTRDSSDSGKTDDTRNEIIDVPIEFRCHAESKEMARDFAKLIVATFTRHAMAQHMIGDTLVNMQQLPDFSVRVGDTEWMWVIPYQVKVDRVFDAISSE